jgi:hypothetical protein
MIIRSAFIELLCADGQTDMRKIIEEYNFQLPTRLEMIIFQSVEEYLFASLI